MNTRAVKGIPQSLSRTFVHSGAVFAENLEVNVAFWQNHKCLSHDRGTPQMAVNVSQLSSNQMWSRDCRGAMTELQTWVPSSFLESIVT